MDTAYLCTLFRLFCRPRLFCTNRNGYGSESATFDSSGESFLADIPYRDSRWSGGGIVAELVLFQGRIQWPHKVRKDEAVEAGGLAIWNNLFDLGILARIIIGAAAAVAILLAIPQNNLLLLIATSLVAGSAGTSVLRALQDRIQAAITGEALEKARDALQTEAHQIEQMRAEITSWEGKKNQPPASARRGFAVSSAVEVSVPSKDIDKLERMITESYAFASSQLPGTESRDRSRRNVVS